MKKKTTQKTQAKSAAKTKVKANVKTKAKVTAKAKSKSNAKRSSGTKAKPKSLGGRLKEKVEKAVERVENIFSDKPKDITSAIRMDHSGLRNFLKILKDTDAEMSERRRAYAEFSALLKSHSKIEEDVVYATTLELVGKEMHLKVTEGYVEHQLADDLMTRIEATTEAMEWSAHANVLSEIVEHHLKEEENDLLPLIKKTASAKEDQEMLNRYLELRAQTQTQVTEKNAGVLESGLKAEL